MSKRTKKIFIVVGVIVVLAIVGAVVMPRSYQKKIAQKFGLVKEEHKRVAAQQSGDLQPLPWDESKHGNAAMTEYLHKVYDVINKPGCRFMNTSIANDLLAKPIPADANGKFQWYFDVCNQLLNCGRVSESIEKSTEFEADPAFKELAADKLGLWYYSKGLVYLRYGEVQNCIGMHNSESCIWPLSKAAQSSKTEGPTKAIEAYTKCLQYDPENLSAMWLMNIAYMQLGEYPDQVPQKWVVPASSLKSEYDVPKFENVAINLGVDNPNMCGGAILDDFNGDGYNDIFTCGWGLKERCFLMLNKGDGTFEDISAKAGIDELPGGLMIQQTDYNNDGLLDVWISRGAWHADYGIMPSSMLRNNGDSTFTDVTYEIGLWSCHPSQASTWADFNNDGWLDLYVGNEASRKGDNRNDCELFLNNKGKFKDVAKASKTNFNGFVKGVTSGDYDNDGDPDLYLSVNGAEEKLYRNETKKGSMKLQFTDVSVAAGINKGPMASFPCWFFDFDNDGWLDILNFSYSASLSENDIPAEYFGKETQGDKTALYHNNHDGTFTDIAEQVGLKKRTFLVMGSNFGDFDMDGWIDFYVGTGKPDIRSVTPNRLFRNDSGKYFQDVSTAAGVGVLQKGHEICFADMNHDGYPEIFVQMGGAFEASGFFDCMFSNPATFQNNWVSLDLRGTKSNKIARGARVKVTTIEDGKERYIYDWVTNGSSFGANSLRLEIGLGKATAIKQIEITWPTTGKVQTFANVEMNKFYKVTEGNNNMVAWNFTPFQFQSTPEKSFSHKMMMTMDMGEDRYMHMQHNMTGGSN